jgi:hypothetical protein
MASRVEYLSFDTVGAIPALALNLAGCWECVDYSQMYDSPPLLGENRHIPGVTGRTPIKHEEDERQVSLPMVFFGDASYNGTPYSDTRIGLRSNLAYFRTNIMRQGSATTRAVTFHRLDGTTTETGGVIVLPPLQVAFAGPTLARAVLTLVIPAGVLS